MAKLPVMIYVAQLVDYCKGLIRNQRPKSWTFRNCSLLGLSNIWFWHSSKISFIWNNESRTRTHHNTKKTSCYECLYADSKTSWLVCCLKLYPFLELTFVRVDRFLSVGLRSKRLQYRTNVLQKFMRENWWKEPDLLHSSSELDVQNFLIQQKLKAVLKRLQNDPTTPRSKNMLKCIRSKV